MFWAERSLVLVQASCSTLSAVRANVSPTACEKLRLGCSLLAQPMANSHCLAPLPPHVRIPNAGGWPGSMRRMPALAEVAVAGFRCFMLEIRYLCEYRAPIYIGALFGPEAQRPRGPEAQRPRGPASSLCGAAGAYRIDYGAKIAFLFDTTKGLGQKMMALCANCYTTGVCAAGCTPPQQGLPHGAPADCGTAGGASAPPAALSAPHRARSPRA